MEIVEIHRLIDIHKITSLISTKTLLLYIYSVDDDDDCLARILAPLSWYAIAILHGFIFYISLLKLFKYHD